MTVPVCLAKNEKLRVFGFISGSGKTLFEAYHLQKKMEAKGEFCPFEIVGLFVSKEASKGAEVAAELGLPVVTLDIKAFYAKRDAKITDRTVRAAFDREVLQLIEPFEIDVILLAGYVWATTDEMLDKYPLINVHPADLSVVKDGLRQFAGKDGVGDTLKAGSRTISSTSHMATNVIDGGPILMISKKIEIDYTLHEDETERFRYYLGLVNQQGRLLGARTILEIASGHFTQDADGNLSYKGHAIPAGVRVESWEQNKLKF